MTSAYLSILLLPRCLSFEEIEIVIFATVRNGSLQQSLPIRLVTNVIGVGLLVFLTVDNYPEFEAVIVDLKTSSPNKDNFFFPFPSDESVSTRQRY